METFDSKTHGDIADGTCPHRVWFGDYALHYCDKDRGICEDVTECNKKGEKEMKLKHNNGIVTYLMRTGKDFVRSTMTIGSAQGIINKGESVVEKGYQIIVDDKYFFPLATIPKRKKQTEGDEE